MPSIKFCRFSPLTASSPFATISNMLFNIILLLLLLFFIFAELDSNKRNHQVRPPKTECVCAVSVMLGVRTIFKIFNLLFGNWNVVLSAGVPQRMARYRMST